MACTWGSKVNGILTVVAIGLAVLIDLWGILDHKKEGHTMVRMCSSRILFHQLTYYLKRLTFRNISLHGRSVSLLFLS